MIHEHIDMPTYVSLVAHWYRSVHDTCFSPYHSLAQKRLLVNLQEVWYLTKIQLLLSLLSYVNLRFVHWGIPTFLENLLYYRFIVRFPIGLDFIFITFTFLLHLLLSWTSSLSYNMIIGKQTIIPMIYKQWTYDWIGNYIKSAHKI